MSMEGSTGPWANGWGVEDIVVGAESLPLAFDVDRALLVEGRVAKLIEGDEDITKENLLERQDMYRALVHSTLDAGETDPEADAVDLEEFRARTVQFGREAAALTLSGDFATAD